MSSSNSIKSLCEELIVSSNSDETLYRTIFKLLNVIKSGDKNQKEVFINLGDKGLSKIMLGLKSDKIEIRKLSIKLLIELIYNNEVLQNIFCEKFNFNPIGNTIVLNWFPSILKENLNLDGSIINEIKSSKLNSKNKFWMWPSNSKYSDENYPDPQKYLMGFFYSNKSAYVPNINVSITEDKNKDSMKNLISKLEKEENEENERSTLKNKIETAAGSGSESASKIKEGIGNKRDSENFDKYIKTEPLIEEKKRSEGGKSQNKPNNILVASKIPSSNGNNVTNINPIYSNVSPFKKQNIVQSIRTKLGTAKNFLNTSDLGNYSKDKTEKRNKHYSKSIDTKENHEYTVTATNNYHMKTVAKSPLNFHQNKLK